MSLLPIISREEARQKGLKRFFTGKPCKHGHVCERRVDSSECAECGRTRGRAYHRRPDVKERVQAHRQQPDVKERIQERVRAWAQRPEVRERRRAYHRRPEVKERKRRPEVRAQQRAYQQRPDVKERRQRPEVKERRLAYLRIWRQRPDVKERIRAYSQRRGLAYRGNGGGDAAVRDQRAAPGGAPRRYEKVCSRRRRLTFRRHSIRRPAARSRAGLAGTGSVYFARNNAATPDKVIVTEGGALGRSSRRVVASGTPRLRYGCSNGLRCWMEGKTARGPT